MKGYRFYLTHDTPKEKREGSDNGNCVAIDTDVLEKHGSLEGFGPVFFSPNSPVCWSGISSEYLRTKCKRISEARARKIHPELFKRLDS